MTDIADLVAPRLTDDELDALLLEHRSDCGCIPMCDDATCSYCDHLWPCETWRLATEVRDLRAALQNDEEIISRPRNGHIHTWIRESPNMAACIFCCTGFPKGQHMPLFPALARYEEGGR